MRFNCTRQRKCPTSLLPVDAWGKVYACFCTIIWVVDLCDVFEHSHILKLRMTEGMDDPYYLYGAVVRTPLRSKELSLLSPYWIWCTQRAHVMASVEGMSLLAAFRTCNDLYMCLTLWLRIAPSRFLMHVFFILQDQSSLEQKKEVALNKGVSDVTKWYRRVRFS